MATITAPTPAPATTPAGRRLPPWRRVPAGLLFTLPFLVFYVAFLVWPTLSALYLSFFNESLTGTRGEWVGLANWAEMFGDSAMWASFGNTLYFTLLTTPPLVVLGLVMALLTNRAMPLRWLWRMSFFAPFLLPASVVALIWIWLFQPGFGLVNDTLTRIGLAELGWLTEPELAMVSVAIATVWWTVGFNYLLYLAALQQIPQHLYDAAAIDGAGWWQRLRSVTLPMLRRTTGLVIVLQILASLRVFDQIYLLYQGTGGPGFAARPILEHVYTTAFTNFRFGYASAISTFFFALIVAVSAVQLKLFARKGPDR
ncbi:multiple sugar transport system permease protein [Thermocatellispora tengchongensis]|uniref:Multiple sugar transport system permease protein n=1 Tax=Thermocatellispora tengchongensis TaxID=1073253 RepID=A0A840P7V2_9ACTN|nr:sugar ABC transporter permease [Thermocatellispora tengchongensis]MBB5135079.1 multiple sugar transport system permease protein [Thermocatellispora tengchongensis]